MSLASASLGTEVANHSDHSKRKWDQNDTAQETKRPKTLGPFVMDDDDECDDGAASSTLSLPTRSGSSPAAIETGLKDSALFDPIQKTVPQEKYTVQLCSGRTLQLLKRKPKATVSYEQAIASRSTSAPGKAKKSYYGVDIHNLLDIVAAEQKNAKVHTPEPQILPSVEQSAHGKHSSPLWTEKYRARKFVDLVGDDRTHRLVLRWLKGWDDVVFPGLTKFKPKRINGSLVEERAHRKILLLAGPPGLGKTTLAHVCARQAGYEVMEINASDERSSNVVKGRIRDAIGTENVKSVAVGSDGKRNQKANRPVCLVIDEVDGVVGGSGGGEGGFIKALIDLVMLDKKNSGLAPKGENTSTRRRKTDRFRLLRPLILICNDLYHPSLRPLRTSSSAEIIHVRQAPLEKVINRMKSIFQQECISFEADGVRRLCEASWGLSSVRNRTAHSRGIGEGDIRGILVAGEWLAKQLRTQGLRNSSKLTKRLVDQYFSSDAARDAHGLGRGGAREVVDRVFVEGAGFASASHPVTNVDALDTGKTSAPAGGVDSMSKRHAIEKLGHMIDASGEYDRCVADCFLKYPTQQFQDDTFLSKPNKMYDWLNFHDNISSRIYSNQAWELNKYMSQSVLVFHALFASSARRSLEPKDEAEEELHPFSGLRADFAAHEAQKQHRATLVEFHSSMSPALMRLFRSQEDTATELVPNLLRMLSPDIKPNLVGGAGRPGFASIRREREKELVQSAVRVMRGINIRFEKTKVEREGAHGGWIYRMEPPLDTLVEFSKIKSATMQGINTTISAPARFAVRQVLAQELQREALRRSSEAGQAKMANQQPSGNGPKDKTDMMARLNGPKKDFFGRIISENTKSQEEQRKKMAADEVNNGRKTGLTHAWIKYHDGFSNAVRKRITMQEMLSDL